MGTGVITAQCRWPTQTLVASACSLSTAAHSSLRIVSPLPLLPQDQPPPPHVAIRMILKHSWPSQSLLKNSQAPLAWRATQPLLSLPSETPQATTGLCAPSPHPYTRVSRPLHHCACLNLQTLLTPNLCSFYLEGHPALTVR